MSYREVKEKIVLALDVDSIHEAEGLITELADYVGCFKIGLQLYTAHGQAIIDFMRARKLKFFLDVKLHDIPNTVASATKNIVRQGASFFNVHAQGGRAMMEATVEAARDTSVHIGTPKPLILAVTVLTSLGDASLQKDMGIHLSASEYALKLAKLAHECGLDGVVASVHEVRRIKEICGNSFKVLCPGIRPAWSLSDDQARVATPAHAIAEGADFLVIGRAVTSAKNRIEAMQKLYMEL